MLRDHLANAIDGHGSLVLIGGEAGIGKTALAEMFCREAADQGALVLVGRCYDLSETPPYGPWVELFGKYKPGDTSPILPAAFTQRGVGEVASQATLFYEVREFLIALAVERPLVLFLDDLHWSDPASLDLLRFLGQSIVTLPLMIVVTYRSDDLARQHPLYQLLPVLEREAHAMRLDLRRLPPQAVHALLAHRYPLAAMDIDRLAAHLFARAAGNVFFTLQLLRALEDEEVLHRIGNDWEVGDLAHIRLPMAVGQVIDGRFLRLDAESQRLLAVAAVLGQEVPFALWAAVIGQDEEALLETVEQATAAHLIDAIADGTGARFAHALIREALYEGIVPLRRRGLHRQIGETLAALPHPDPDAVAYHFQQAGDSRAITWFITAGEQAKKADAMLTAAARFEAALAMVDVGATDAGARGVLLYQLGWVHSANEPARSVTYLKEAQRVAAMVQDTALMARAQLLLGLVHCRSGDARQGIREMEAAHATLEAITISESDRRSIEALNPDANDRVALREHREGRIGLLVLWYAIVGRHAEARTLGEPCVAGAAVPIISAIDLYVGLAEVYAMIGMPDAAQEMFTRAKATHDFDHMIAVVGKWELQYLRLPYRADDLAERRRGADETAAAMSRAHGAQVALNPRVAYLPVLALEGAWEEARQLAEREPFRDTGAQGLAAMVLGALAHAQGDTAVAWSLIREWFPDGPTTAPGSSSLLVMLTLQRLAAALALDASNRDTVRTWLAAHDRWLAWSGAVLGQSEGQALWAQYYRQTGDVKQAYRHAERALAHATGPRQPIALLTVHRLLGELDTDAGRYEDAALHLAASLALADACVAPYERALTLLANAELYAATGDRREALNLLDEVRTICEPLSALPTLTKIDALVAQFTPTTVAPSAYPADLSAREVEVLRLIVAGRSNRDIAAALYVSERTVDAHVRHILAKTGAENRAAAAAFALRQGLA